MCVCEKEGGACVMVSIVESFYRAASSGRGTRTRFSSLRKSAVSSSQGMFEAASTNTCARVAIEGDGELEVESDK